jgi:predicted nucleic acid-binding protein
MTFLLDVNMLIAAIWEEHADHARVNAWLPGKKTATCPISRRAATENSPQF